MESNENLPSDISQFLDQFEKENSELERAFTSGKMNFHTALDAQDRASSPKNGEKERSFKKLEEKIAELEKKFENSLREKEFLLTELAKTKTESDAAKNQNNSGRDAFYDNIALTIANLRDSVDRLNRAQSVPQRAAFMPQTEVYGQGYYYGAPIDQASKIGQEELFKARQEAQKYAAELSRTRDELTLKQTVIEKQAMELAARQDIAVRHERELTMRQEAEIKQVGELSSKQAVVDGQREEISLQNQTIAAQKAELTKHKIESEEKERFIEGLKEKTSRLKAVNAALEKEFKRVQEEKITALKKSAEQAKEILSLREQLAKAEEGFKSFDFEGRMVSVKTQYQQKVSKLETQLQEVSAVCMRQVEEIENLKTERAYFKRFETDSASLQNQLENKNKEIDSLRAEVEHMSNSSRELLLNLSASSSKSNEELNAKILAAQDLVNTRLEAARSAFKQKVQAAESKAEEAEKAAAARIREIAMKAGKMETDAARRVKDITQKAESEISALNARMLALQKERDAISERLSAGLAAKTAEEGKMQATFKTLMSKIRDNDAVIEGLKSKIEILNGENESLRKKTHSNYLEKKAAMEAVPAGAAASKQPELAYPDPAARKQSRAQAAALGKAEAKKDFLEDTQTFFGRMKWSLLKDD